MPTVPRAVFDALRARVHERCFAPSADDGLPRIGAEVEFLALDALSRGPVPVHALDRGLLALLRRHARIAAWTESRSAYGTPQFVVAGRATVSFEPGGQIEIATVACASASTLIEALETVVAPLRVSLAREGVTLVSKGIDPCTAIAEVELQLRVDRYERMTRYFDRIGPFGARMMRQTAAVQISVDRGPDPAARWRLLNDVAPYLVALFANSTHYAGADTGHRSYRSHCWRMLDASRTGVAAPSDDPAAEYTRFALGAADMMRLTRDGEYRSFGDWAAVGKWTIDGWERHLTRAVTSSCGPAMPWIPRSTRPWLCSSAVWSMTTRLRAKRLGWRPGATGCLCSPESADWVTNESRGPRGRCSHSRSRARCGWDRATSLRTTSSGRERCTGISPREACRQAPTCRRA
jgi:hypothetical protein